MNLQHLIENGQIVQSITPDVCTGAKTGTAVSLKNYRRALILYSINQANAATSLITPEQCTAVAGTGAKAIPAVPIYVNLDTAASNVWVAATAAANYTTDAGLKVKTVAFIVDAAALDVAGGFDCLRVKDGASNVANVSSAVIILLDPRYAGATTPSARVD